MKTYTTRAGDMWDSVAFGLWGDETRMGDLIEANLDLVRVTVFDAGRVLAVPEIASRAAGEEIPPWRR
jgi:4-hydroxy-3-methylbut-2-en-1-yl diphosphate synthase IspG/GcpE